MKQIKKYFTYIVFWFILFFPFLFITISFCITSYKAQIINIIKTTLFFFFAWLLIIAVLSYFLTVMCNVMNVHTFHRKITYNKTGLEKKKIIFNKFNAEKFGNNLKNKNYYSVHYDNNIELNQLIKLYQKENIDRRDFH
ncbi:hypothetical protein M2S00_05530 [Apilactobacillus sp. TMW 2.2459]|uniref:hypothetical protein n=1 Tax=Apilactobacillus xinyiensis TaxID=2841032 RepID=UPI00200FC3E8|nr:hypothetical protein [Apilactobacillus xinyiensis]MCL0312565.1 hypothetical protein [Apilactobacillus xinyiensis]